MARVRLKRAYARDEMEALRLRQAAHCIITARVETLFPVHNTFHALTYYQGDRTYSVIAAGQVVEERGYDRVHNTGWERQAGYINALDPTDLAEAQQSAAHTYRLLADLDQSEAPVRDEGLRRLPNGVRARCIRVFPTLAPAPASGSTSSSPTVATDFYLAPRTDRLLAVGYRDRDPHRDVLTETLTLTVAWMPTSPQRPFVYPRKLLIYQDGLLVQRVFNVKVDCATPIDPRRFERPAEPDRFSPASHLPTHVALTFVHGYCVVPVYVNGASKPARFLLDTGAASSSLSLPLARRLGLRLGAAITNYSGLGNFTSRLSQVRSLRVGEAEVRDLPLDVVMDDALDRLTGAVEERLDGILGNDFYRAFQMTLDYGGTPGPELLLDRPDTPTPSGADVPAFFSGGALAFLAHLAGGDLTLAVDTGAPMTWLPPRYADRLPADRRADWSGLGARAPGTRLIWLPEIKLPGVPASASDPTSPPSAAPTPSGEEIKLPGQIAWSVVTPHTTHQTGSLLAEEYEGLFGSDLLRYFRITFDFRRGALIFVRLPQPAHSRGDMVGVGIWPDFRKPSKGGQTALRVFIAQLWPFSPAAQAGLHVGDELLEINGKPVQTLSEQQIGDYLWQGSEGKSLHISLRGRADAPRHLDLEYRRLF
jgi:hypothetical protein